MPRTFSPKISVLFLAAFIAFPVVAQPRDERPAEPDRASRHEAKEKAQAEAPKVKQATQDAALTGKVKSALAADVGLKTLKINVDSAEGVVTLKGAVDSAGTAKRAEAVARKVGGVKSVQNKLKVQG